METPRLDCGHPVAGREAIHYCGDCLERLVWERDTARKLVLDRDATISHLVEEHKRVLRQVAELEAKIDRLEDVDYRDSD